MTHTHLPIFGPSSQPGESDGAELDYMRMPAEMATYAAPDVPEPEDVRDLVQGMAVLETLLSQLRNYEGKLSKPIALAPLDEANRALVDQVLGEGDVSIVVDGSVRTMIQESVLTGVWRVQSVDSYGTLLSDHIEVSAIPWAVKDGSFTRSMPCAVSFDATELPVNVMNAPPLLTEINEWIPQIRKQGGSHTINLSLLPQTEEDLAFLQERLGSGRVVILSRGYGNCRITSTNTRNVWWVQYFNSQDSMILNTLEITAVPEVACAAVEDIADSAQRLNEILEVYR